MVTRNLHEFRKLNPHETPTTQTRAPPRQPRLLKDDETGDFITSPPKFHNPRKQPRIPNLHTPEDETLHKIPESQDWQQRNAPNSTFESDTASNLSLPRPHSSSSLKATIFSISVVPPSYR